MVLPLEVALHLRLVEVHLPEIAGRVPRRLIVEMRRLRIAAFSSGRHRSRTHPIAELDDRHEAVAAGPVHLLRPVVGARTERRERAPSRGCERDGNARAGIVERLDDVAGETLEAIDVAPRRLPAPEVGGEPV